MRHISATVATRPEYIVRTTEGVWSVTHKTADVAFFSEDEAQEYARNVIKRHPDMYVGIVGPDGKKRNIL